MNSSEIITLELTGGYVLTIDEEARAAYLECKEFQGEVFTHPHDTGFNVDFDKKANLVGIEVLNFNADVPPELFSLVDSPLYKAITEMNSILKAKNI